jgi:hypothetical protein
MQKTAFEREKAETINSYTQEISQLTTRIVLLQTPIVSIEAVPCNISDSKFHKIYIRVRNNSVAASVKNIMVEMISIDGEYNSETERDFYSPNLPMQLKSQSDSEINLINPGSTCDYFLFNITMSSRVLQDGVSTNVPYSKFIAYFKLAREGGENQVDHNVCAFKSNKLYPITFAVSADGRARYEAKLYIGFSDKGKYHTFELETETQVKT